MSIRVLKIIAGMGRTPPTAENYEISISSDLEYVVFIADLKEKTIVNSVDDIDDVGSRLGIGDIQAKGKKEQ